MFKIFSTYICLQRLEISVAVQLIYKSLGVKGLIYSSHLRPVYPECLFALPFLTITDTNFSISQLCYMLCGCVIHSATTIIIFAADKL